MLVREGGIDMLKHLLATCQYNVHTGEIRLLAQGVINRCERFAVDGDYLTDDNEQENADMDE